MLWLGWLYRMRADLFLLVSFFFVGKRCCVRVWRTCHFVFCFCFFGLVSRCVVLLCVCVVGVLRGSEVKGGICVSSARFPVSLFR